MNEYTEKLAEKFHPRVMFNIMQTLEKSPDVIQVKKYFFWNLISIDPDDNKFVDCAVAANAEFIVTNDGHFNILKSIPFPKVEVISAEDFVEKLTGKHPSL